MKSYQHEAQFTPLSGISLTLSYITHKSKSASKSLRELSLVCVCIQYAFVYVSYLQYVCAKRPRAIVKRGGEK